MPDSEFELTAASTALLVVDMQNDFLDPEGYFARCGQDVAPLQPAVAGTVELRRLLPVATRVIFTAQVYEPDGSDDLGKLHRLRPARLTRAGGEGPVKRGSWGAQIVPALAPETGQRVVEKRRFDAFYQTDLPLLLRCWDIRTLIFAGVIADVCVESTLRSAYVYDFDIVLAKECVGGWGEADVQRTIAAVESHFGVVKSNQQILAALGS
jgi:ureidoacrylate peracid hydrolase